MTDYYIGKKFWLNPDDENSMKYYEGTAVYCNDNNATIAEIEPVDVEVEETRFTPEGDITEKVIKTLRQFEIQAIPEPTKEDKLLQEKNNLLSYLSETDYVTAKLAEVVDDAEAYSALKEKYADILTKRADARARINAIEAELKDNASGKE